jgi:hypothetical protein
MIDEQTTATTREVCLLAGFTKQRLGKLESQGVVTRIGRDAWPLATTMRAIFSDARERSEAHSAAKVHLDKLRAAREELRLKKECNAVVKLSDFQEGIDAMAYVVLKHLAPLPSRLGGRDLAERKRVDAELRIAQQGMSDELKAMAQKMEETGKAV